MKRKIWIGITIVVVVALAIVLVINYQTKKKPGVIKIGAILPLTGPASWLGEMHKWGIDLAVEEINEASKNKIKIICEDSSREPKKTVSAFKKLNVLGSKILDEKAFNAGDREVEKVKKAIYKIKSYNGVTGETSFDENGDVIQPALIKTVMNGKFIWHERR